ncbi:hypothetical protein [Pseudomonas nitroreducens]|uniref:hypothetical protein n=1 Tax=Pseudomonas nitroreducens TaxID=46680 RepID=UPI002659D584|nr:hypothetical protein [Pseudomonas nitroreducens]MCP1650269.1 hypothetical protein [Pseudomonas nitroreducens]MCP1687861.1 hypothetical protein [Pseudomonas nitroreducens]
MKPLLIAPLLLIAVQPAFAAIPMLNYDCPNDIQVHTDEGGPVYINGKEAKVKQKNDKYLEAKGEGVTISISLNDDGSATVSYTGPKGANGICQPAEGD